LKTSAAVGQVRSLKWIDPSTVVAPDQETLHLHLFMTYTKRVQLGLFCLASCVVANGADVPTGDFWTRKILKYWEKLTLLSLYFLQSL